MLEGLAAGWPALAAGEGVRPVPAEEPLVPGAGWPDWLGAGAPNECASRCSGAGSAPAAAVPQTARATVASIPAAIRGILRGGRLLRGRAVAPVPGVLAAMTNAAT